MWLYTKNLKLLYRIFLRAVHISPVIKQKGESQNGCFKKTKHVKFSEKRIFFTHMYVSGGKKCSFFRKFDVLCFLEISILRFVLITDDILPTHILYYPNIYIFLLTLSGMCSTRELSKEIILSLSWWQATQCIVPFVNSSRFFLKYPLESGWLFLDYTAWSLGSFW